MNKTKIYLRLISKLDLVNVKSRKITNSLRSFLFSYRSLYNEAGLRFYASVIPHFFIYFLLLSLRFSLLMVLDEKTYHRVGDKLSSDNFSIPIIPLIDVFLLPQGLLLSPFGDFTVVQEVFVSKVYDRFIEPEEGFVVVDVGAHIGSYTLLTSRKIGAGRIFAVEPDPWNYTLLTLNIALNHLRNVIPIRTALSYFEGSVKLYLSPVSRENSTVVSEGVDSIEVPVTTLDHLMARIATKVDLIKIDVEGAEREVLEGAESILKQRGLNLVLAAYHSPTEAEELKIFLKNKGFNHVKVYYIDDLYPYVYARKS